MHHITFIRIGSLALILNFLFLISCGDDSKFSFPGTVFTIKKVFDVGNSSNASDVRVTFSLSDDVNFSDVKEIRLVITKSSQSFTAQDLDNLAAGNFFSTMNEEGLKSIKPDSNTKDTDGNQILAGVDYKIYLIALGSDGAVNVSSPKDFKLANKPVYEGDYVGTWNDDIIKDLRFSLRIADDYTGSIFYTDNFMGCCGPIPDATLIMKVSGSTIDSFSFDQYILDYPAGTGGHCPAQVNTKGRFKDDIELSLDSFPFSDCDGAGRTVRISDLIRQ